MDDDIYKLIQNDSHIHVLWNLSIEYDWSHEQFLTECVKVLAQKNAALSDQLLHKEFNRQVCVLVDGI